MPKINIARPLDNPLPEVLGAALVLRRDADVEQRHAVPHDASVSWNLIRDSSEEPRVEAPLFWHGTWFGQNRGAGVEYRRMTKAFQNMHNTPELTVNFLTEHIASPTRMAKCDGSAELHFREAAVMLAMTNWLFSLGSPSVEIHPDGMHLKGFPVREWIEKAGFTKVKQIGKTTAGGIYRSDSKKITVDPRSGIGDVVAEIAGKRVEIEAKEVASTAAMRGICRACAAAFTKQWGCLLTVGMRPTA